MKKLLIVVALFICIGQLHAQPPYWNDITAFKKLDAAQAPPQNAILFVGSSSFTKWKDVADYFPGYTIINRGFGGSTLVDVIRYTYDVILPYKPKEIVIYCGENDLAESDAVNANDVVTHFKTLFGMIRQNLPNVPVYFVSLKPSPSRKKLLPKMEEANKEIKAFLQKEKKAGFIDVYHAMLDKTGEPQADLFVEDNLHMNAKGYTLWKNIILPYLIK